MTLQDKKTKAQNSFIPIISLLFACFYPTSINGDIYSVSGVVFYYFLSTIIIIIAFNSNKKDTHLLYLFIIVITYLGYASFLTYLRIDTSLSLARFAPIVLILVLFTSINKNKKVYDRKIKSILEFVTIIILVWNIGIVFGNKFISYLTVNYYSQFMDYTVKSSVGLHKPIFTFGVHTFASFYYMLLFYLWYETIKVDGSKFNRVKHYIFLILIFLMTIYLRSSTSLMFSLIMLFMLIKVSTKKTGKILLITTFLYFLVLFLNSELFTTYKEMVISPHHGIIPRYLSNNHIFIDNFEVIKKCYLGIGFTIPHNYSITYTDSGYIVYYTMGGIVLVIIFYYMLYRYLRNNIDYHYKFIFILIMLFELAIPSLIYMKTAYFFIFIVSYLNYLTNLKNGNSYEKQES